MSEEGRFPGFRKPNYTMVPDELFDELLPTLNGGELKVLLYIIRRTFGFKKDSDNISLNQMLEGIRTRDGRVLDRGTGLARSTLAKALKELEEKNIIVAEKRFSREQGFEATSYRLNILGAAGQEAVTAQPPEAAPAAAPSSAVLSGAAPSSQVPPSTKIELGMSENRTRPSTKIELAKSENRTTPSTIFELGLVRKSNPQETVKQQTAEQETDNNTVVVATQPDEASTTYSEPLSSRRSVDTARESAAEQPATSETDTSAVDGAMVEELVQRGVTRESARTLASRYPAERIQEKIGLVDRLVQSKSPLVQRNPAGYLRRAIEEDYEVPQALRAKAQAEDRVAVAQGSYERVVYSSYAPPPQDIPGNGANREIDGYGDCGKLWAEVLQRLELQMAHSTFDTWLRNTEAIGYEKRSDSEEVLLVRIGTALQADWVANRLIVPVQRALKNALGRVPALEFVISKE